MLKMDVNKLFLFSKNTDAFSAQRGYNYQTLKTLETWVQNFLDGNNEDIYCEFEEDIFHKDNLKKELKFRQIKLYSSDFSFSSEEIKKSIFHFFMLHTKLDYRDFTKEFIFETNSTIRKKYKNNDAELLREWSAHQENLDEEKTVRYAKKIKEIVTKYVNLQQLSIKDKVLTEEASAIFEQLDNNYWQDFTKMIKWKFIGTPPDEEYVAVRKRIEELIPLLPHPGQRSDPAHTFSVLLERVFTKVTQQNNEDRKLTKEMLQQALLSMGSDQDKWYADKYEYYRQIDTFRIGEFYEMLDLVNYCRRKIYLHGHKGIWNPFITFYARDESIDSGFRRRAIYELIFLNNEFYEVDYENLGKRERPAGSLIGFEEDIRFYFSDFSTFKESSDLENARIIITILLPAIAAERSKISNEELKKWYLEIYKKVCRNLINIKDINEKCNLLEQKGVILMGISRLRKKDRTAFLEYFNGILDLADQAPLFQLSRFGERIEKQIKIQIHHDPKDEYKVTEALEEFSERLFPLLEKQEGKIQLAKSQSKRGFSYLKTNEPKNMLKALGYFHKAKENYLLDDTIEGYIICLLSIARIYNALGMHYAAKNYALGAYRMSTNKELIDRVENCLAIMYESDFRSGSWFNALNVYSQYMGLKFESNFDRESSEEEVHCTQNAAFQLYTMKRSFHQFNYLIQDYIKHLDYVGSDIILPLQSRIQEDLKNELLYLKAIESQVDDFPLNDIGKVRTVSFYALGSLWKVSFPNTHEYVSIAEEYVSAIQIILAEIALSEIDFHLLKSKIEIELSASETYQQPKQLPSNEIIRWKVFISRTDTREIEKINLHSAFNMVSLRMILNNVSVLQGEEFITTFDNFFQTAKLDTKQWVVNLYQKIHRDVYSKKAFDAFKPDLFTKEELSNLNLPSENRFMVWDDSISAKYDQEFSLRAIKNRFNNTGECTYLTLKDLQKDPEFPRWLAELRVQGYKDWQIMVNIQNFMINYKVNRFENKAFDTEKAYAEHFQEIFHKYANMDEKECYIVFPLEAFKTKDFYDQFNIGLVATLKTYGLETKLMTPNFKAIREFLNIRFNLENDDYQDNNPLKDL